MGAMGELDRCREILQLLVTAERTACEVGEERGAAFVCAEGGTPRRASVGRQSSRL